MKIGVFGDSFAEQRAKTDSWWAVLGGKFGHEVTCFGESGSSLSFSAAKILDNFSNYDFIIWCVTSSNRITVWHRADYTDIAVHITGRHHIQHSNPLIQQKIDITEKYLLHAWDSVDNEFIGRCIIDYVRRNVSNLLLVPCFGTPIYDNTEDSKFDLHTLCDKETKHYFPNKNLPEIYDEFRECRICHFTKSTNLILADKLARSLSPGIFIADYAEFPKPTQPLHEIFQPLK